jgi:hypothetical protein
MDILIRKIGRDVLFSEMEGNGAISLKGLQKNQFNLWGQILRVTRQCQVH